MTYEKIEVERRSAHLGGWIRGIDLREELDAETIAEIKQALLEFHVIFFRDQPITGEQHLAFAARFGEIDNPHPVFGNEAKIDRRLTIIESKGRTEDAEHYWHTDVTYQEAPSMGSILAAKKIPQCGGDTLFASMYAAYDALSPPIQRLCEETHRAAFDRARLGRDTAYARRWRRSNLRVTKAFSADDTPCAAHTP